MSEYTPTTDEIETAFHEFASELEQRYPGEYVHAPEFADWQKAKDGFRRWLAEERRAAAEKALAEVRSTIGAYNAHGVWAFDQAVKFIERAKGTRA